MIVFGLLSLGILLLFYDALKPNRVLPIYQPAAVSFELVDSTLQHIKRRHRVSDFSLTNQNGKSITQKDYDQKIVVVDFFFTHCPTICPSMTAQMKRLSDMTVDLQNHLEFFSFSIDPKKDQPARLREYMASYEVTAKNWQFLTGKESTTHLLAKEFFNGAERNDAIDGGFGHTPYFALVDTEGLVRGVYNGTLVDDIDRLELDIRKLLNYEYGIESK